MEKFKVVLFFLEIFLLTQLIGVYVGSEYLNLIRAGEALPAFENPERVENSLYLIGYIIIFTGVIILILKYKRKILKIVEALAIFFASYFTFDILFPVWIYLIPLSLLLALGLTLWKMLRPSFLSQNLALIFSVAGAGAILGASLGMIPVLILIALLSIYDFVSVFLTKHMKYIAKEISKTPTAFTAAFPYKFKQISPTKRRKGVKKVHVFQHGGGDIAIPLIFSVSILRNFTIFHAFITIIGSAIALSFLIWFALRKPGIVLPALPWVSAGTLLGFLFSLLVL